MNCSKVYVLPASGLRAYELDVYGTSPDAWPTLEELFTMLGDRDGWTWFPMGRGTDYYMAVENSDEGQPTNKSLVRRGVDTQTVGTVVVFRMSNEGVLLSVYVPDVETLLSRSRHTDVFHETLLQRVEGAVLSDCSQDLATDVDDSESSTHSE